MAKISLPSNRKCFNIQRFTPSQTPSNLDFADIILTSNKSRPVKQPVAVKRPAALLYDETVDRGKSNPAKRLRSIDIAGKILRSSSGNSSGAPVPSCGAFVDLVQQYIKSLLTAEDHRADDIRRQISILEIRYQEKCAAAQLLPTQSYQKTKLEGSFETSRQFLLKKLHGVQSSMAVQIGREVGIQYIFRYQQCDCSDEEKLAIVSDFKGRFCGTAATPVQQCNTMICQRCNVPMFVSNDNGFLMCKTCGTIEAHSDRVPYVGINNIDDADSTAQSTKKVSNFRDYLHLLQGKKINIKLEADYPLMLDYVTVRNVTDLDTITVEFITKMLVCLGKRKYIKYMALLESRLRNVPLLQMSLQLENKFCSNFLMLTDPYERHKPPSRKHFMSYAYCGWQFCRIEKCPEFNVLFRLLKDPAKIVKQDDTFAKICPEIGWIFEPSAYFSNKI
jgi:hypothetical protein